MTRGRIHRRQRGRVRASITKRVGAAVAVVGAILLLDLASTLVGVSQLSDLNNALQQRDVPLSADTAALLVALVDEETGLRGFLLTRDQSFEQPLKDGQAAYASLVPTLRKLAVSEPSLTADMTTLVARVDAWQAEYVTPALASAEQRTPTLVPPSAATGKALFDSIRAAQAQLASTVTAETSKDFATAAHTRSVIFAGVIVRATLGVGLGILLLLLALRAILGPLRNLREVARTMMDGGHVSAMPPPAPPELMEVHEAIVAAGIALQETRARAGARQQRAGGGEPPQVRVPRHDEP